MLHEEDVCEFAEVANEEMALLLSYGSPLEMRWNFHGTYLGEEVANLSSTSEKVLLALGRRQHV